MSQLKNKNPHTNPKREDTKQPISNINWTKFIDCFQRFRKHELIIKSIKFLYFGLNFTAPYIFQTPKPWVFIIAGGLIYYISIIGFHFIEKKKFLLKPTRIIALVTVTLIISIVYFSIRMVYPPIPPKPFNPCDNPTTLHDHFECDFGSPVGINIWKHVNFLDKNDTIGVPYESQLYQDFSAQSCFLGLYIPNTPFVYDVCEYLSHYCDSIITELKNTPLKFELSKPNEKPIPLKNLKFSGAVYIYHETSMLSDEIDSLNILFKNNHVTPQFRSNTYIIAPNYNK